jgi:mannose-6-phosphate isomerase-like protein (cupin superfamily)
LADPYVKPFLASWPESTVASRVIVARGLPVLRWMPSPSQHPAPASDLVASLHRMHGNLAWSQTYRADDFGAAFLDRYGWTELIGARGPIASERLACGFLLLGPDVEYPSHHHAAEEIYMVLSGTAGWQRGDEPWTQRPPGALAHHPPNMRHAMRTSDEPLLALYLWRGGGLTQKSIIG